METPFLLREALPEEAMTARATTCGGKQIGLWASGSWMGQVLSYTNRGWGAGGGEKMCLLAPVAGPHTLPNVQPDDSSWPPIPAGAL